MLICYTSNSFKNNWAIAFRMPKDVPSKARERLRRTILSIAKSNNDAQKTNRVPMINILLQHKTSSSFRNLLLVQLHEGRQVCKTGDAETQCAAGLWIQYSFTFIGNIINVSFKMRGPFGLKLIKSRATWRKHYTSPANVLRKRFWLMRTFALCSV